MAHQLRVLGPPEILDGEGSPIPLSLGKPLGLLVYVACSPSPVSRKELAEVLWPNAPREKGRHSVRQALWVLRGAIGEDLLDNEDPLSLREGALEVDLHRFVSALAEGRIHDARDLWRGPALDNFVLPGANRWNHWKEELRTDVEHRFCRALLQEAEARRLGGDLERALILLEQAIEVEPSTQAAHLGRIELLLELLRTDAAREALADARRALGAGLTEATALDAMEERLELVLQEERSRVQEAEGFPLEFVGRSKELATLQALWRDALLARARVGLITGPPGIGKTRLAQEFVSGLAGREVRVATLKGTRAEMRLRWGAAAELARQLLRFPGSAGISSASDSLFRAMLPSLGRNAISLQTVNGVSPAAILDAAHDLLESVSFESHLVLLLDDFQWVDPESRTLFLGLARRVRDLRILFLFVGRSDLSSRHWEEAEEALMEEAAARRLHLSPLIQEEVGELLALGAAFESPEAAERVVRGIYRASGGNPLFVREILRELHERGGIRQESHGWVFRPDRIPETFAPPENIQAFLRERLGRLSASAATVAATLAREDRQASAEALQRDTRLPESVFTQAVAELLERGVLEWVGRGSLDFVHDLLRDTAKAHLADHLPLPPPEAPWVGRRPRVLASAILLVLALPLGILWHAGVLTGNKNPEPLPYGGARSSCGPPRAARSRCR